MSSEPDSSEHPSTKNCLRDREKVGKISEMTKKEELHLTRNVVGSG
jgi:hypothetical protein